MSRSSWCRTRRSTSTAPTPSPSRTDYAQVNLAAVLFAVSDDDHRRSAGPADAEGPRDGADLDPAVQDHGPHPSHARARPPRGARGADRRVHSRHRRDVLVGHGRRGAADRPDGRLQPQSGPDPRPAPGGRSVDGPGPIRRGRREREPRGSPTERRSTAPSDRPAGPGGCPIRPSRRRRPRRRRGQAARVRTRAWLPIPPTRRSRPSDDRA